MRRRAVIGQRDRGNLPRTGRGWGKGMFTCDLELTGLAPNPAFATELIHNLCAICLDLLLVLCKNQTVG